MKKDENKESLEERMLKIVKWVYRWVDLPYINNMAEDILKDYEELLSKKDK